ncbi:hypothetical protein EG68_06103 [Paragonimus skrjabini miyazakii]|uniref:Galactokinase n=1 Tax=Paragonimus skrjabini miyazakii TaxID=59628 RepID=A0A8S9YBG2_9TREM|nr:hypothetical protein EG68_06103 [Paragonimus skrjabini miyazakii]
MVSPGEDQVPIYPLNEIASKLSEQLKSRGFPCHFVVRAPGRVNLIDGRSRDNFPSNSPVHFLLSLSPSLASVRLSSFSRTCIGEHIDYNGYAVLPMALEQSVYLAVAVQPTGDSIVLSSSNPECVTSTVSIAEALEFGSHCPPDTVQWFHYPLCAYHGIADYVKENQLTCNPPSLVIHVGGAEFGGLWPAAGLSSSSALVVASAIAIMRASGLSIGRRELAGLCARCERYIGMQGGGMDQAASLLGSENSAVLIEFTKPLVTVHPVPLPSDVVFVIAHSGVHARKAATSMYNERVSECRIATRLLIKQSPEPKLNASTRPLCLADAQQAWKLARPGLMLASEETVGSVAERFLKVGIYTRDRLFMDGLMSVYELDLCLTPTTKNMTEFKLRARAEHVYAEAERTLAFYDLCQPLIAAGDTSLLADLPHKLGELMNQSQESCAKLYECSCPALDELVNVCKSAGAIGSRLTGAGWGGCTVSLVPVAGLTQFMHHIRRDYYEKRGFLNREADQLMFVSKPGPSAGVMLVD